MTDSSSLSVQPPEKWSERGHCRLWKTPAASVDKSRPVETRQQHDEIDSQIANALSQLTMGERDRVYYEIHGVEEEIEESRGMIDEKLERLEQELRRVKANHPKGEAFRLAEQTNRRYVNSNGLRVKFLRSESFSISRAADRMIRFFDIKLYLFGKDLLCCDITTQHLSKDDLDALRAGFIQNLPVRDRAGRAICVLMPNFQKYKVAENMTRVLWFMLMCLLDDEETQKRGFAGIIYNVGAFVPGVTDMKTISQGCWVQGTVPLRLCSLHHCFHDSAFRRMVDFSMNFFGEETKARAKMHHGTHLECVYNLMTFGIPPEALPVTTEGQLKRKNHMDWIKMRKQQEEEMATAQDKDHERKFRKIVLPSRGDVLFGRGKPFREHIGNVRLYNLLDENLILYESLKLKEKSRLISKMVETIKSQGGRFLKQDGLLWEEANDKQAHEKVSHAFRSRLRIVLAEARMKGNTSQATTFSENVKQEARSVPMTSLSTSSNNSNLSVLDSTKMSMQENEGVLRTNNVKGQNSVVGHVPRTVSSTSSEMNSSEMNSSEINSPTQRQREEEPRLSPFHLGLDKDLAEFSQSNKKART